MMRHCRQVCAVVARQRGAALRLLGHPHDQRIRKSGGFVRLSRHDRDHYREQDMTTAYYSTVLDHPLETVWSLIRDFNNYPAYIEGVSESMIEDDKRGDEVGAIRRFY